MKQREWSTSNASVSRKISKKDADLALSSTP